MPPSRPRTLHRRAGNSGQGLIIAVVIVFVILVVLVLLARCSVKQKQNPATTQRGVGQRVAATPGQVNRVGVRQEVDTVRPMEASLGRGGLSEGDVYALAELRRRNAELERGERERGERERVGREREQERVEVDDAPPPTYEEARKQPRADV